jgi:lysophospholipase L1-like esterase
MSTTRRVAIGVVIAILGSVGAYAYALAAEGPSNGPLAVHARSRADSAAANAAIAPTYGPIALVGDSLSVQAGLQEQARLRQAGWSPVTANAQFGRRIPWDAHTHTPLSGIAAVNQVRASVGDPHTWIIELGTNDVAETHDDAESIRTIIESMLAVIGPGHRIVWVTVHHGFEPAASVTFNRVLGEIADQRTDLVVADWWSIAETPGYLIADHIHLTTEGEAAFADLIAATADQAALLP